MSDQLRPFQPLDTVLPDFVIAYLRRNPDNSMPFYEGIDQRTGKPMVQFFIKTTHAGAQYVMDSPSIQAHIGLEERTDDPNVGHAVFAFARFQEAEYTEVARGIKVAIVEGLPKEFSAESEFPVNDREVMKCLLYLVEQRWWQFVFISNDCKTFFNAKEFNNPLTPEERREWNRKIRVWRRG